jgi:plastocyanin
MRRTRMGIVLGLATLALAAAGCGGGDNDSASTTETATTETTSTSGETGTTLQGSVGPGFEISLTGSDGQAVSTLTPGTYTIDVNDQSDAHNFHLTGPGVEETTDVGGTGTTTWTVTLQDGSYHFQCDPHASTMNGDFEVSG